MRLSDKAAEALDYIRDLCGHNYSLQKPSLVTFTGKGFSYMNLSFSPWDGSKEIESSSLDIDGIVIGYNKCIIPIAMTLGAIEYEKNSMKTFLFLPAVYDEMMSVNIMLYEDFHSIIKRVPVLFDERDTNAIVKTVNKDVNSFWWRPKFYYNGNDILDDKLAYIYCRNRFLDLISTVWSDSFIIRPREYSKDKSIKTIGRASILANLLLLDRGNFDVFSKKGKCPAWQISALSRFDVNHSAFSPKMKDVFSEVSRLQDVADFWKEGGDAYGWALRLSTDDLEDDKIEDTKKKISIMADLIGLDSYLDAYEAGVPASDILA